MAEFEELFTKLDTEYGLTTSPSEDSSNTQEMKCKLCGSETVSNFSDNSHDDYIVCSNKECGIICSMNLDPTSQLTASTGTNYFYGESSLGTKIGGSGFSDMKRLHNWHIKTNKERSRNRVAREIDQVGHANNIPDTILENAYMLYDKIINRRYKEWQTNPNIRRRINRRGLIASLLIISSQIQKKPINNDKVAKMCKVDMKQVMRSMKTFNELLSKEDIYYSLKKSVSSDFVKEYCNQINIPTHLRNIAMLISDNLEKSQFVSDHQPPSLAATAILLMAERNNYPLTRKDIKREFSISEPTLNKIHKKVSPFIRIMEDEEISKEFISDLYMKDLNTVTQDIESKTRDVNTEHDTNDIDDDDDDEI